ncbi:CHAD domain-containing protein [Rhizobium etli]|uniref:CYTH and CHAD domain-containing protein n=1 Tax=Rhizobium etli TaxID=29449 RepID=UPI001FD9FA2A|nr:CHAD domain-containing protein [Rhizobium etli]
MSEIELKLDLAGETLDTVLSSDLLGEPQEVIEQTSTYFDTPDRRFIQDGYSLRIRKTGTSHVQTIKATGPAKSLFSRSEWETPVKGLEPVIDLKSPVRSELGSDLELERVFTVELKRRVWKVDENGSRIEVVLDTGAVLSGDRQSLISEMELELKDGNPKDLFVLARKVDNIVFFRIGVRAKSERGFALIDKQQNAFKAEKVLLEQRMRTAKAFQEIALSCFRQFRLNEDVLLKKRNAEALHQARVAIRRLRSAFSMFKSVLQDDEPRRLTAELRWLAGMLGEARNIDVLLAKATDADLRDKLKDIRDKAYDEAIEALGSSRARALMLDLTEWLHCDAYLTRQDPVVEQDAATFAVAALEKMRKKLKTHGRALAEVDDEHRHQVRKDAKKLRYGAEFFVTLFDGKPGARRHKKFLAAMSTLQDHLGDLNDLATGPDVLDRHGLASHPARDSVILHADKGLLIAKAQQAVDEVLDVKRFWR